MVSFILPGNSASSSYEVANSLRFDSGSSDALTQTPSSSGNRKTFTISLWTKPSSVSQQQMFLSADNNQFGFENNGVIFFYENNSGTEKPYIRFEPKHRDPSAWYHICLAVDTTQSTDTNRMKLYVNGTQITSFSSTSYPSQNDDLRLSNSSYPHTIGEDPRDNTNFDGYIAEMHCLDGTAYDASYFGETNSDGVWVPKEYTGGNYGTNGFFMEFKQTGTSANSSGKGADTSGQDNHFDDNNMDTQDICTDTPTNNFATGFFTAKFNNDTNVTYNNGALYLKSESVATSYNAVATFGASTMPFYFEVNAASVDQNNDTRIGVTPVNSISGVAINGEFNQIVYRGDGSVVSAGETSLTSQGNITDGTVVGVACDPDNNVKFYLDGSLTSTISINSTYRGPVMIPYYRHVNNGTSEFNFGNPPFSGCSNADANGYGQFKYSVPSGYYALCTKNLAELD